jgi:integrase
MGFELNMAKKPFKPSHVELRYRTYFALLYVPKDVRHIIKKAKFYKSTETDNLKQAEAIAAVWVINWKSQIEKARSIIQANSANADINSAIKLYEEELSNDNPLLVKEIMEEEEIRIRREQGERPADIFKSLASGKQRYLKNIEPEWLKNETAKGLKEKTIHQMQSDVELLYQPFPTANLLTHKNIETFLTALGTHHQLSASSIKRIVGSCRNFYIFLKAIKEVPDDLPNPFVVPSNFRISNKPNSRAKFKSEPWQPLDPEDVVYLYGCALMKNDIQLSNLILIGAHTGARIEEICSLQCKNVDLINHSIKITDSKTEAGKRLIPIHSDIRPVVEHLVAESKDGYLISGLSENKYKDRSNAVGKRFGRLKTAEGFGKHHVFHSIRKTLVTMLENKGVGENVAADIVGHEKPRITYGLYSGGTTLDVMREALERISYEFPDLDVPPSLEPV